MHVPFKGQRLFLVRRCLASSTRLDLLKERSSGQMQKCWEVRGRGREMGTGGLLGRKEAAFGGSTSYLTGSRGRVRADPDAIARKTSCTETD